MPDGFARADACNPELDKLEILNTALKEVVDKYGVGTAQMPVARPSPRGPARRLWGDGAGAQSHKKPLEQTAKNL